MYTIRQELYTSLIQNAVADGVSVGLSEAGHKVREFREKNPDKEVPENLVPDTIIAVVLVTLNSILPIAAPNMPWEDMDTETTEKTITQPE